MSLDRGVKVPNPEFKQKIYKQNLNNLCVWMSVGADVENGLWAIYGALEGCHKVTHTDWDFVNVRDFKWLNEYWEQKDKIELDITLLNAEASAFFKKQMKRENTYQLMTTEQEVYRRLND